MPCRLGGERVGAGAGLAQGAGHHRLHARGGIQHQLGRPLPDIHRSSNTGEDEVKCVKNGMWRPAMAFETPAADPTSDTLRQSGQQPPKHAGCRPPGHFSSQPGGEPTATIPLRSSPSEVSGPPFQATSLSLPNCRNAPPHPPRRGSRAGPGPREWTRPGSQQARTPTSGVRRCCGGVPGRNPGRPGNVSRPSGSVRCRRGWLGLGYTRLDWGVRSEPELSGSLFPVLSDCLPLGMAWSSRFGVGAATEERGGLRRGTIGPIPG
jgi:hypothetical protein